MTICLWKNLLGVECPGCGMTHAILAVLHGQFALAWAYNRSVVVVLPLLVWVGIGKAKVKGQKSKVKSTEKRIFRFLHF